MKKVAFFLSVVMLLSILTLSVTAAEETNVAEGKSYTVEIIVGEEGYGVGEDGGGYGDGVDAFRQRLTDGVKVTDGDGGKMDGSALAGAQSASELVYIVDLEAVVNGINRLSIDLYRNEGWGMGFPESVEYFISEDGESYASVGKVNVDDVEKLTSDAWEGWDMVLELSEAKSARYVKLEIEAENYVWATEIEVFAGGEINTDPKPDPKPETPSTGDNFVYVAIALIPSGAGVVVAARKNRAA